MSNKLKVSPLLANILKKDVANRSTVFIMIWRYIKLKGLVNKDNLRIIECGKDPKLKTLFNKEQITAFEMAGIINRNIL